MNKANLKMRDIFWNTLGTCTYSVVSLFLSIIVINIAGKVDGGTFSFGFSTLSRLMFIITFFGIRPMHIVDVKYRYSFNDYKKIGKKMGLLAISIGLIYVLYRYITNVYTVTKTMLLILLLIHGVVDGYADYYESEYQRAEKLYMGGQSLFFRILAFTLTLVIVLYITSNLFLALIIALFFEILVFYIMNIKMSKKNFLVTLDNNTGNLFCGALPLFLITFLDAFLFSYSKLSIDTHFGDIYNGLYSIAFMPTNAIYLLMTLFMKPLLTPLANAYNNDKKLYNSILLKTFLIALSIAIISIIAVLIFGKYYFSIIEFVLNNTYADFLNVATKILTIVIIGGSFYTICTPMYFALIIEEKRNYLLIAYIIAAIITIFSTRVIVERYGMFGCAYSFVVSMFFVFFNIVVAWGMSKIIK